MKFLEYVGAGLTAATLLIGWVLGLLVAGIVAWSVLRVFGVVRNRRAALVAVVPLISASEKALSRARPVFMVVLAIWAAFTLSPDGRIGLPKVGSAPHQLGLTLFILTFMVFAGAVLPLAYGVSLRKSFNEMDPAFAGPIYGVRLFGGVFVAWLVTKHPGPQGTFAVILILVYAAVVVRLVLGAVAWKRYEGAPRALARTAHPAGSALFIHLSDIHITSHRSGIPTGGGRSGLERLTKVAAAISDGSLDTPLVLVSGDIVDRGDDDEWELAMSSLRQIRACGVGVVLAPGNHDLLLSYSPKRSLWALLKPPSLPEQAIDGEQVHRFYRAMLALEGRITTWNGAPLSEYVDQVSGPWPKVRALWDDLRVTSARAMGIAEDTRHVIALSKHRKARPAEATEIASQFAFLAGQLIPPQRDGYWRDVVFTVGPDDWADLNTHAPWRERWYEPYPLRLILPNSVEFVIANSNPPIASLLQSSLGACGDGQMQRLNQVLVESESRTIIVMHHHAVARWENDPYGFQRWGTLAHDLRESKQLFEMLSRVSREGREVFLLSGHVHASSRAAFVPTNKGDNSGFWYLESAALGEGGGRDILAGIATGSGVFEGALLADAVRSIGD